MRSLLGVLRQVVRNGLEALVGLAILVPLQSFGLVADSPAGVPGDDLNTATDRQDVPKQTRTTYDGAGRVTAEIFQPNTTERWRTTTLYGGDHTDVTPPAGGTATSTVTDASGRTVATRQYKAATPTGDYDATIYTFNAKGQLKQVTDTAGNAWSYTYDLRGQQLSVTDPDKGKTTKEYDNAGRMTSATDARGIKLLYQYDELDRRTALLQSGSARVPAGRTTLRPRASSRSRSGWPAPTPSRAATPSTAAWPQRPTRRAPTCRWRPPRTSTTRTPGWRTSWSARTALRPPATSRAPTTTRRTWSTSTSSTPACTRRPAAGLPGVRP